MILFFLFKSATKASNELIIFVNGTDSNEYELTEKSFRHLSQGNLFSIIFGILGLILISFNVAYRGQSSNIFLVLNIAFSLAGIVLFFLYRNYKLSILFLVFGLLMLVPLPLNIFVLSHN